uniref:Receptor protein-tyrosine kinase n=1 Tax=Timema genevievae TaxID=629358 RepID=A0A7R9JVU9_TIMGE|nr:unnamed protein product [Timema genevievae]
MCRSNSSQTCGGFQSNDIYETTQITPGPPASLEVINITETSIQVAWTPPLAPNGEIQFYEIEAKYINTFSTFSLSPLLIWKIYSNSTGKPKAKLLNLQPGTQYNITIRANNDNGAGISKSILQWTLIGEPDTPELPTILKRDEGQITIKVVPTLNDNGPITAYHIVVIDGGSQASYSPEMLLPYQNATNKGLSFYIAAELKPEELKDTFVVGDGRMYGNYYNPPLPPGRDIHISLGVVSTMANLTKVAYARADHEQHGIIILDFGNMEHTDVGNSGLVVGLSVAIGVLSLLLLLCVAAYFVLRRRLRRRRRRLPSDHQELSLQGPMIEVDSNGYNHNGYMPDDEERRVDHYEKLKQQIWNIPRNFLEVKTDLLGHGQFGNVMQGTVHQRGLPMPVAINTIADGELSRADKKLMLQELDVLIRIGSHNNVIHLVGVCENPDVLFVVFEYHPESLKNILLESRCLKYAAQVCPRMSTLTESQVIEIAVGTARGMAHLCHKKIVHKQLAARNVLMADGIVPKITGIGIAQYNNTTNTPDYTRWTAQEIFRGRQHTTKSDVWSFGCLLWELVSLGGTPYADTAIKEVPSRIMRGHRLHQMNFVGDDLYQLMLQCWQLDLDERPTFDEIVHVLENFIEDSDIHINFNMFSGFHYEQYFSELEST